MEVFFFFSFIMSVSCDGGCFYTVMMSGNKGYMIAMVVSVDIIKGLCLREGDFLTKPNYLPKMLISEDLCY